MDIFINNLSFLCVELASTPHSWMDRYNEDLELKWGEHVAEL
jgi:hypothetical protein